MEKEYDELKQKKIEKTNLFHNLEENMKNLDKHKNDALEFLNSEEKIFKLKNYKKYLKRGRKG